MNRTPCFALGLSLVLVAMSCAKSSVIAPDANSFMMLTGPLPPTVALFDLHVDPDTLSAELTPVRSGTTQPPQNLSYDLDIGKFLTHETLQVAGLSLDNFSDVIVRVRHRHPFPAPNFSAGITAKNRADLSYTGRLFVFAETDVIEYAPGITLDNALVREPDGWASPGDLLLDAAGLVASHYPYMLLVDEAKDNREGVSNGNVMTGNYDAATGGWQRGNAGPEGDAWTGFDYMHGGQSVVNDITLRRVPMAASNWTVRLAVVIQYTDPRGLADLTRRFPSNPTDVAQFAYRLPYAALDVSKVETNWDVPLRPGDAQLVPLEVRIRDWDAEATETNDPTLADDPEVDTVQVGGAGTPDVTFTMDQVYTGAQVISYVSGSGLPGDELIYRIGVHNDNHVALGNYRGLLKVADREAVDPNRGDYHFGVDATTLAPSATRRLDPVTVYPLQFQVPYEGTGWSVNWGDYKSDGARAIAVDSAGNVAVACIFNHPATDLIPGEMHARVPWVKGWDIAINLFNADGVQQGGFAIGGSGNDFVNNLAFDSEDNLVLMFNTISPTFDVDPGPGILDLGGAALHFGVVKYSPAGTVEWGAKLPEASVTGSNNSTWIAMAEAPDDELLFGGCFEGTADFDPGAGVVSRTSNGGGTNSDAVLLRLRDDGAFRWVRIWGSANDSCDIINAIACNDDSDVVAAGSLGLENSDGSGTIDLNPTAGNDDRPSAFRGTPFYARLQENGNYDSGQTWLKQSTGVGEPDGFGEVNAITLDNTNRVYVRGGYAGTGDFDPGVGETLLTGYLTEFTETFTASYDTDDSFRWAFPYFSQSNFGGEFSPFFINPDGDLVSIGYFNSTDQCDFDPGPGVASTTTQGLIYNQYLASYTTDGTFRFLGKWGSLSSEVVSDLAPTPDGRLVLCGSAHPSLSSLSARLVSRSLQNSIGGADAYYMNLSADCEW